MSAAPLKILIVDDEPPIRKLLRMGLGTQGYDVLEASNGKIALELLSEDPALIILDLGLPDIQGHDLLRMIRGRNRRRGCHSARSTAGFAATIWALSEIEAAAGVRCNRWASRRYRIRTSVARQH